MTRYLALYIGSAENTGASTTLDAETQQKGMAAWGEGATSQWFDRRSGGSPR